MMLTNLATIARGAGLHVIEQPGWKTRGHGQMSSVQTIVCHHTAGPAAGNAPSLATVQNGRPDLAGPLSHFLLARDGTVYVVAAGLCYHAGAVRSTGQSNAYAVGIEAEATGTTSWPAIQMDAYARLCKALCAAFDLPVSKVLGHKEICAPVGRKMDPNFEMAAFRERVAAATNSLEDNDMQPTDAVKDPGPDKWGHEWLHASQMADRLDEKVDKLTTAVAVQASTIGVLAGQVSRLQLTGGTVTIDYAALAKAVNDDAARRMQL